MNVFGINIARGKAKPPQKTVRKTVKKQDDELSLAPVVRDADGNVVTQAKLFVVSYTRNAALGMLKIVKNVQTRAGKIARIALSASIVHQIGYVISLSLPFMHWKTIPEIAESVTMVGMAFAAPIVGDLLILSCIETIGGAAVMHKSKMKAMFVMVIPVGASGYVNFLVTGPLLLKCLSAFVVVMVPLAVSLQFIRPDWVMMDELETGVSKSIDLAREKAKVAAEAAAIAAAAAAAAPPTKTIVSGTERRRNRAKAEKLAVANPNMTVSTLVRESGVSRPTAAKILSRVNQSDLNPMEEIEKLLEDSAKA